MYDRSAPTTPSGYSVPIIGRAPNMRKYNSHKSSQSGSSFLIGSELLPIDTTSEGDDAGVVLVAVAVDLHLGDAVGIGVPANVELLWIEVPMRIIDGSLCYCFSVPGFTSSLKPG